MSYFYFLKQLWLHTTEKKQNETKPSENPVLLAKDIVQKTGKLDRELMYLLNKAKYYVPKTKQTGNQVFENKEMVLVRAGKDMTILRFLKEKLVFENFLKVKTRTSKKLPLVEKYKYFCKFDFRMTFKAE